MVKITETIKDVAGIGPAKASKLVSVAASFGGPQITITGDNGSANLRSIMDLMGLSIQSGETITIAVDGHEEEQVLSTIKTMLIDLELI